MQASRSAAGLLGAALQVLLLTVPANGQETTRVSVDSSGLLEGDGRSFAQSISANGQVVAFESDATNLVAGDTNGTVDIFVHDRATGITERVSVDSAGAEADGGAYPSISADGNVVAFSSYASNLVAGDTNGYWDVFVHERSTGLTERISVDSSGAEGDYNSGGSYGFVSISADGQIVAFASWASNLVPGDTNGRIDAFVRYRSTGITERVSVDSAGAEGNEGSGMPSISADGQIVAFASGASNLVAGDTNGKQDIFVHDHTNGITERVSVRSNGKEGNDDSPVPTISADGKIVAFWSYASNLVAGDTNGDTDVFVHVRATGITERVSVASSGAQGNDESEVGSISADGQTVAFQSLASNLVAGDTNGDTDVFVHDRTTGITERVSVDSSGAEADGGSGADGQSISADGQVVAFGSSATNLVTGDANGTGDVFVHDRCAPATWTNYGAGFPGTNGIPAITSQQNPVVGTTITIDVANSYGNPTVGLLFIGFQQMFVSTNKGGDLLVVPALTLPVTFSYSGDSFTGSIPDDHTLCGVAVDLQSIEADPGAAKGMSFTAGLELVLGH